MKIQLAYKVTGEDRNKVIEELKKIVITLEKQKDDIYCPILDPNQPKGKKEMFLDAIDKIEDADAIFALIKSGEKSEGMLMEIGHALGLGKKLILAIKKDILNTHLRILANQTIEFSDINDLITKLSKLKI